ncbi:ABC transporter ATP-binding protein [Sphingomonas sp. HF-S4]|uniref:ABC transporter ATP-binding protein n=1 Tax=Sphingomonas agrestis TaxID=3080540 RepID=A0ABU3Y4A2_9SPHN|nr:ABC transporter ATP-binding protein [Sphingomonas sp. HF-S4]MDV3456052.1 ABC transporter ATP-binding protein [Sphingomonas sp. HF-S4]
MRHFAATAIAHETLGPIVAVSNVTKHYGQRVALDGISFRVDRGEMVGILGPNGAGKSTLLRLLLRLSTPTSGEIEVAGHGRHARTADVARSTGYVAQDSMFDYRATPRSELTFQGRLFGLPKKQAQLRAEELLANVGLDATGDVRIVTLSGGNRRRLDMAMAQLHSPELIILDEPTQGLDVESRAQMWDTLEHLGASGVTILFSTHDMAEAEKHARRLLIVKNGKILADDTTAAICAAHRSDMLILTIEDTATPGLIETARRFSTDEPWIAERHLFVPMANAQKDGLLVAESLRAAGASIVEFEIKRQSLEAAYLAIAKTRFDKPQPRPRGR